MYFNAKCFFNNNSSPCTPCVYSNELHVTNNSFTESDSKEKGPADKKKPDQSNYSTTKK